VFHVLQFSLAENMTSNPNPESNAQLSARRARRW
jgi:hypothetical protein